MTPQQAANVVAVLNAGFPRESLEPASVALFVEEIRLLSDGELAVAAARKTVREGERFPTLKEFRQTYRSLAEAKRSEIPALPEPRDTRVPEWVHVWCWARRAKGEGRMFPQQDEHGMGHRSLSLAEYEALVAEWREAGAPHVTGMSDFLLRSMPKAERQEAAA